MAFDKTNASDLASLKDEVQSDPEGVGYAAVVEQTSLLLDLLNLPENNPQASDEVNVPFDEFLIIDAIDEINAGEYDALTGRDKTIVDAIIQSGISTPNVLKFGPVKKLFRRAFGTGSTTWGNVKDDRKRQASRAEALFGRDTVLSREDWFAARDS